jgi:hypothetical protein
VILRALTPGTTIKFPLSVKMSTVNQRKNECTIDTGPLALTLVNGKQTSALMVDWVPYAPGGINFLASDSDVLSGIFTGCVMASYLSAKQRRVAHVHTGDDAGADLDCKDLMKNLLATSYAPVFAFKPFDRNSDVDIATGIAMKTTFGSFGCAPFGLITAANSYHVIFTRKVTNSEYVIEAVRDKSGSPYAFA